VPQPLQDAVTAWRKAAISRIEQTYCGQPIEETTLTYQFTPLAKTPTFTPRYFPLRGISELKYVRKEEAGFTMWDFVNGADYGVSNGAIVKRDGFEDIYTYQALLRVGYEEIPSEIVEIFYEMIVLRHKESNFAKASRLGLNSISESMAGTYATTSFRNMHEVWQERLEPFRTLAT
jgi:hypothetical protein